MAKDASWEEVEILAFASSEGLKEEGQTQPWGQGEEEGEMIHPCCHGQRNLRYR